MTSGTCEWCKRYVLKKLETHHIIPRWCGGTEDETNKMEVCHGCHTKLDRLFENFIKWGQFTPIPWENKEKSKKQKKEYYKNNKRRIKIRSRDSYEKRCKDPNYLKRVYQKRLLRDPNFNRKKVEDQRTIRGKMLHKKRNQRYRDKKKLVKLI